MLEKYSIYDGSYFNVNFDILFFVAITIIIITSILVNLDGQVKTSSGEKKYFVRHFSLHKPKIRDSVVPQRNIIM